MKTNPGMQESMYAHNVTGKSPNRFAKPPTKAPANGEDQKVDNFTSISNVRSTANKTGDKPRHNLMGQMQGINQKKNVTPGIPSGPNQNQFQLETIDQWKFEPDKNTSQQSNRLGKSARLSQEFDSARSLNKKEESEMAAEYNTLQQVQSV